MKKRKQTTEYVDNEKFFLAMVRYKQSVEEALAAKKPKPRVPDYIGECILKIAKRLSHHKSFGGYSYREEMISDGVENCILYIDNFDPEKTQNPFAYFTQIVWYAFIRRIQKEHRQQYIKAKELQSFALMDSLNEIASVDRMSPNDAMNDIIVAFEKAESKKKEKKPQGLERFTEDNDE